MNAAGARATSTRSSKHGSRGAVRASRAGRPARPRRAAQLAEHEAVLVVVTVGGGAVGGGARVARRGTDAVFHDEVVREQRGVERLAARAAPPAVRRVGEDEPRAAAAAEAPRGALRLEHAPAEREGVARERRGRQDDERDRRLAHVGRHVPAARDEPRQQKLEPLARARIVL